MEQKRQKQLMPRPMSPSVRWEAPPVSEEFRARARASQPSGKGQCCSVGDFRCRALAKLQADKNLRLEPTSRVGSPLV